MTQDARLIERQVRLPEPLAKRVDQLGQACGLDGSQMVSAIMILDFYHKGELRFDDPKPAFEPQIDPGLVAAAPESSGNPGELRVEPSEIEWAEALHTVYIRGPKESWRECMEVSAEAYRLAAAREARG